MTAVTNTDFLLKKQTFKLFFHYYTTRDLWCLWDI